MTEKRHKGKGKALEKGGENPLTERQKGLVEGIKKGMNEGKTTLEIAESLSISEPYVNKLKTVGGLTKKKGESVVKDWIEEHTEVKDWLREIKGGDAHKGTKIIFAGDLKKYCEFRGLTPEELLDEAEEDVKLERRKRRVKSYIMDFRDHLKDSGRGKNTISVYMSAIRSFFGSHQVLLPKLSNGAREIEWEKEDFTREKVKQLISVCSPREKAIFLTMFQSGLAANEVSNIRIKDLKEVEDGITVLRLKREKNGYKFITFLGRDAQQAIEQYLRIRNEGNLIPTKPNISKEASMAKIMDKCTNPDCAAEYESGVEKCKKCGYPTEPIDYLFITYNNFEEQWNKISARHISTYMLQACKKLGWYNGEKRNPWRPHALRASFATILNNNGVPKNFCDFMLAHKQGGTDEAYFKQDFDTLLKYYKDSEHLLSISDLDKVPDSKYAEMKMQVEERNGEISELKQTIAGQSEKLESIEERISMSTRYATLDPDSPLYNESIANNSEVENLREKVIEINELFKKMMEKERTKQTKLKEEKI